VKKRIHYILLLILVATLLVSNAFALSENTEAPNSFKEEKPIVISPGKKITANADAEEQENETANTDEVEASDNEEQERPATLILSEGSKLIVNEDTRTLLIFLNLIFFLIIILPLIPGIIESFSPEDNQPLQINMDYSKDIHYFDNSFREMLTELIDIEKPGVQEVTFHDDKPLEEVHVISNGDTENISYEDMKHIMVLTNDLMANAKGDFRREIYVKGNTTIGPNSKIRAIVGDRHISFDEGCQVQRWIGCPGEIKIEKNCNLGIRAVCDEQMTISERCIFKSIYGLPIVIGKGAWNSEPPKFDLRQKPTLEEDTNDYKFKSKWTNIPANSKINKNILAKKRGLVIGEKSIIKGNVSASGKIILKKEVVVEGNLFAEGDIIIHKDSIVKGNIYSLKTIKIKNNVKTGTHPDKNYIIAKKELEVGSYVNIYGNVRGDLKVTFDEYVNLEGNLFSEGNIDLGPGTIVRQNIFTQSEIHICEGVLVGRPEHIKSIVAKKGIEIDRDVTIHGFLSTDGTGVVS